MAKFVLLLVALVVIESAVALECYNCFTNPLDKNCDDFNDKDKIRTTPCGKSSANFKAACIKKVVQEMSSNNVNTTRACVLLKPDGSTDNECKAPSDKFSVLSCNVCMDDLCNSAPAHSMNIYTGFATLVSLFLTKYVLF